MTAPGSAPSGGAGRKSFGCPDSGEASAGARAGCDPLGWLRSLTFAGSVSPSMTSICDGSATSISGPFRLLDPAAHDHRLCRKTVERSREVRIGGKNGFADARREIRSPVLSEIEIRRTLGAPDGNDASDDALIFAAHRHQRVGAARRHRAIDAVAPEAEALPARFGLVREKLA